MARYFTRVHRHPCKGDDGSPCPQGATVGCRSPINHDTQCKVCYDRTAERILFGTKAGVNP